MSLVLVWELVKEKENSEIKPIKKKIDLVLHPALADGLVDTYTKRKK